MSNYKKSLFLVLFYLSFNSFSYGQFSKEMTSKFGKVTQEEVEMTSYELYPDAEAIVLFETCEIVTSFRKTERSAYTDSPNVPQAGGLKKEKSNAIYYTPITTKEVHRRIKIFNKTAFEQGNISIPYLAEYYSDGNKSGQSISKIKASTA